MKIDKNYELSKISIDTSIHKNNGIPTKHTDINRNRATDIQISKSAKELARYMEKVGDAEFSDRVENIRKSIIQGNYKISSEDIAEKILKTIELQKGDR